MTEKAILFTDDERFHLRREQIDCFTVPLGDRYGDDIFDAYFAVYAGVARKYRAARIFEIGVRYGATGICMMLGSGELVESLIYRGIDDATDVLSFDLATPAGFPARAGAAAQLGEVVISYPTARRQAREAGQDVDGELAHLVVHGLLHLLGYDHERPREAREMQAREEAILGRPLH